VNAQLTHRPPIRILVVGVGSIGERHVRCFQKTGRASVSICETNDILRADVGARYAISQTYRDILTALSQPHDAAVIAVPADVHVTTARQAVDARLPVLIEKPLSVTSKGVAELRQQIIRHNLVAAVGYVYRAHPALAEMKSEIDSGRLGKPIQVTAVGGQYFPKYRPSYQQSYYVSQERGGGAIQDAMTHLVNASEWLVGPIHKVVADADHKILQGSKVEDVVHFLARHQGGALGTYALNQYQAPNEVSITVVCENGTVRFEYHRQRWQKMLRPDDAWEIMPIADLERDTLFVRQANAFLDAIERTGDPLCTLDEGIQSLRVNLALLASIKSGHWLGVDDFVSVDC